MATYPIKVLKDESGVPFVPLVSSTGITSPDGTTLEENLNTKLEKENIIAGDNIILTKEGNNITITGTASGAANKVIDNLTTSTANEGVLDAHQGYVLNNKITEMANTLAGGIPKVINNLTTVDTINALSAYQGYLLNNKFNNYLPLSGGTITGTVDGIRFNGKTRTITVAGDSSKFYPVVISLEYDKGNINYISIWKNLGTPTPALTGNHSNGTSSMWLMYEGRFRGWDGNGGMVKTIRYSMPYANLCAHTTSSTKINGGLIVYLRGGNCEYKITTNYNATVDIYYETTNLGTSEYVDNVSPLTTADNGGKYTTETIIGSISGNAATATTAGNVTGIVAIANGGTGGTTAGNARVNLGVLGSKNANGYYGMTAPEGTDTVWIRTTTLGIIPYQAGGNGSLGTSGWPFSTIYCNAYYKGGANVPATFIQSGTPTAKQTGDIWFVT